MVEDLFIGLAPYAGILDGAVRLAAAGKLPGVIDVRALSRMIGLPATRIPDLTKALRAAQDAGVVSQRQDGTWLFVLGAEETRDLGLLLRGARLYADRVHKDRDLVRVVLSKPAAPSQFVAELDRTLDGFWGISMTEEMLGEMAARATSRFSIMTPFVDAHGANRIVELFEATRVEVQRDLIVREGLPQDLRARMSELRRLGVRVYDFRLPRFQECTTETFHAKVVRVDGSECYVGSSNMTKWSFNYSLEMGFHVIGEAGRRVSSILDAVMSVSSPIAMEIA